MEFIDINCDMGENCGNDSAMVKYISSANIACGGHAGDFETMKKTIFLAKTHNVSTGAHPGYPDKSNFGRIEKGLSKKDIFETITEQVHKLQVILDSSGSKLSHIKLHGALYNRAASDYELMYQIAKNINTEFGNIPIFTLAGSVSEKAVADAGGKFISEGFADRAYDDKGTLVSRKEEGAVLANDSMIAKRVLEMVRAGKVISITGNVINLSVNTVCVHGDTTGSVIMASNIYKTLQKNHISIGRNNEV